MKTSHLYIAAIAALAAVLFLGTSRSISQEAKLTGRASARGGASGTVVILGNPSSNAGSLESGSDMKTVAGVLESSGYKVIDAKVLTVGESRSEYWIFADKPDGKKGAQTANSGGQGNDLTLIFNKDRKLDRVSVNDDDIHVRFGNQSGTVTLKDINDKPALISNNPAITDKASIISDPGKWRQGVTLVRDRQDVVRGLTLEMK